MNNLFHKISITQCISTLHDVIHNSVWHTIREKSPKNGSHALSSLVAIGVPLT